MQLHPLRAILYVQQCHQSVPCRNTFSTGSELSSYRFRAHSSQFRLLPGIEPADDIDNLLETRALQQAAGNHATVSTLAVNRDGRMVIPFWRRNSEVVKGPPRRVLNVRGIPLRLAAHVEHLHVV